MVNIKRRTTLKAMTGVAAIAATPVIAAGKGSRFLNDVNEGSSSLKDTDALKPQAELSIALDVASESTIRLTNNSNRLLQVKHVYPGIIHAGAKSYDVNSVLANNAVTLSAGETRTVKIQPNVRLQAEIRFPRERYRNQPQRIASVTGKDRLGELVNSTRSFYG